jgi:hypothetical protein
MSRIVVGAIAAVVVLGGVWYTASLRAENALLREQIARHESSGLGEGGRTTSPTQAAPAPGAEQGSAPQAQRMLSQEQRDALVSELSTSPGNKVWFVTQPNDPEASWFQQEIEYVFLESGWEIAGSAERKNPIKPGLYMFIGDEEPAAHVSTALRGLRNAGLELVTGAGYRAYYEKRKAEDPSFVGYDLSAGQDFVIVVGPNPDSTGSEGRAQGEA